jgi:hypothetical protein
MTTARSYPSTLQGIADETGYPTLPLLTQHFLYEALNPGQCAQDVDIRDLPVISSRVSVFHSATATYYAPSDICGVQGMLRERIYSSCRTWRGGPPRHDCIVAERDPDQPGMRGLFVAQVLCFFSFQHQDITYPCALVRWFTTLSEEPCELTGMWKVVPELDANNVDLLGIIHTDSILRSVHLIPVFDENPLPENEAIHPNHVLGLFRAYYVNKYADHHSHEILF